jgi:hypothetical protein
MDRTELIALIREAFSGTPHPGDDFLPGCKEGRDALEAVAAFRGYSSWEDVEVAVLDAHYDALNFLSEGGFRFFLPAYLVADVRGELQTADPVFHLAGGFHDITVEVPIGNAVFSRRIGKSAYLNPRRYGAMTFEDYARYRLAVFSQEEAAAIVPYLEHRQSEPDSLDTEAIEAALRLFWRDRARHAPEQSALDQHIADEAAYLAAIDPDRGA